MFMWITIATLTIYAIIITFFCMKFAMTLLKIQDALQESMDTIDDRHDNIVKILKIPLFYDSPEVRQVLKDIEDTRESLDYIATQLSNKAYIEQEEGEQSDEG
jgi:hypothetical protein